jgi:hypothetical protein
LSEEEEEDEDEDKEVLRRKSWVIAIPMLAKEREVRSQARKVRSGIVSNCAFYVANRIHIPPPIFIMYNTIHARRNWEI